MRSRRNKKPGLGFPLMRIAVIFSLGSVRQVAHK
jgi:hypothetical protein